MKLIQILEKEYRSRGAKEQRTKLIFFKVKVCYEPKKSEQR